MANYTHGRFVWRELMTTDSEAAKRFYGELFGWSVKEMSMGDTPYYLFTAGGKEVGGMMQQPKEMKAPPYWGSYVSVADVDATVSKIKAAGGKVMQGPGDIPNMGRFAMAMDPQGAAFAIWKAKNGDQTQEQPKLGEFCWETLMTSDKAAATKFYSEVLGWKAGKMGDSVTFGTAEGMENQVASLEAAPPGMPPNWGTYVVVEKLADARERAKRLGGKIMMEEVSVPNVGSFAVAQDPQGAMICLFQSAMG